MHPSQYSPWHWPVTMRLRSRVLEGVSRNVRSHVAAWHLPMNDEGGEMIRRFSLGWHFPAVWFRYPLRHGAEAPADSPMVFLFSPIHHPRRRARRLVWHGGSLIGGSHCSLAQSAHQRCWKGGKIVDVPFDGISESVICNAMLSCKIMG